MVEDRQKHEEKNGSPYASQAGGWGHKGSIIPYGLVVDACSA
jgi:hypothetical protein